MEILPAAASDQMILDLVGRWVTALSAGEFRAAAELLTVDGNERDWPVTLVQEVIESYESEETGDGPARVTALASAREASAPPLDPRVRVARWPTPRARPEVAGTVECDLPINGIWSDLTAIFWLRRVPGGLALELYDLHIL
jgi:hypothetical protein